MLLSALLGGLGAYSKRGRKDFPYLAHAVRGEVGQARVSSLLQHALAAHPELCATETVNSLEALHEALARFVSETVAPRIVGSPTTLVLLSHGGSAMLNAPGRLDGPAVLGVGNSGDEHSGRSAVLDPAWLAREVAIPLARAASSQPCGRLLWAQVGVVCARLQSACAAPVQKSHAESRTRAFLPRLSMPSRGLSPSRPDWREVRSGTRLCPRRVEPKLHVPQYQRLTQLCPFASLSSRIAPRTLSSRMLPSHLMDSRCGSTMRSGDPFRFAVPSSTRHHLLSQEKDDFALTPLCKLAQLAEVRVCTEAIRSRRQSLAPAHELVMLHDAIWRCREPSLRCKKRPTTVPAALAPFRRAKLGSPPCQKPSRAQSPTSFTLWVDRRCGERRGPCAASVSVTCSSLRRHRCLESSLARVTTP